MVRRIAKTTLSMGIPFGVSMGLFFALQASARVGLIGGAISGAFFGICVAAFLEYQRAKVRLPPTGEPLVWDGPASHLRGLEVVGGWLYLTNTRLLFRPHRFNIQRQELSLSLEAISDVRCRRTAWVIPNGLDVVVGELSQRFVVQDRRAWVARISEGRRRLTTAYT